MEGRSEAEVKLDLEGAEVKVWKVRPNIQSSRR